MPRSPNIASHAHLGVDESQVDHIRGFDGLRAISIASVVLTHLGAFDLLSGNERIAMLVWGETGVNIFFALSGMLITRLLLIERARTGRIDLRNFYARRFLRLLPPLLVFVFLQSILWALGISAFWPTGLIISFFYLYNYVPRNQYDPVLGPTWSLAVEEQFYLFWPPLVKFLSPRALLVTAILFVLASGWASLVLPGLQVQTLDGARSLDSLFVVERFFVPAAGAIMTGALMALLLAPGGTRSYRSPRFALLLALVLFVSPLLLPEGLLPIAYLVQTTGIAILLAWLLENPVSSLANMLEWQPLRYIGRISYGLYLYHAVFMGTAPGNGPVADPLVSLLLSVLLAVLSYELMERRVLRLKHRFR